MTAALLADPFLSSKIWVALRLRSSAAGVSTASAFLRHSATSPHSATSLARPVCGVCDQLLNTLRSIHWIFMPPVCCLVFIPVVLLKSLGWPISSK